MVAVSLSHHWQGHGGRFLFSEEHLHMIAKPQSARGRCGSDPLCWKDLTSKTRLDLTEVPAATARQLKNTLPNCAVQAGGRASRMGRRASSPTDEFCGLVWLLCYTEFVTHIVSHHPTRTSQGAGERGCLSPALRGCPEHEPELLR